MPKYFLKTNDAQINFRICGHMQEKKNLLYFFCMFLTLFGETHLL